MEIQVQSPVPYQEHLLRFDLGKEQLQELGEKIISNHQAVEDKLAAKQQWKLQDFLELHDATIDFSTQYATCYFPIYVSSDKDLKAAATEIKNKIDAYGVESSMREDMFKVMSDFQKRVLESQDKLGLTEQLQRWLDKEIIDYKRNGLALQGEQRARFGEIKKILSEQSTKYSKNLNDDDTKEEFTKEQLEGMSDDFLGSLKTAENGNYILTLQYPDLVPTLQKCKITETRKRMDYLNGLKGGTENVQLLESTLELRKEMAKLLGYETFADYALEIRMAKNKKNVLDFMQDLRTRLKPFAEKELAKLLQIKQDYCQKNGLEFDNKINSWDFQFYHTLLLDTEYQLDNEKIKQYFPIDKVTEGIFEIYQRILGLRFEPVKDFRSWHEDATCTAVYNSATNDYMGTFYLDMYPRQGKYGHACVIGAQRSGNRSDGTRQHPACVMLCNFTKPTADKPSLLTHGEVETFFHEFGHVMHNICTEAQVYRFSCTQVERDFVEAPSQMLENWTYEEEPLRLMSGNYQNLSEPLPKNYLDSIVNAKNVNTGLLNLRQLFFGIFDMHIHTTQEKVDTIKVWDELRKDVSLIQQQPGTHPSSGFGHIMGGYQAGYYGYLWSQVYSADMYEGGFKNEPLNAEHGMRYRKCILAPGGSQDGIEMIRKFLGREPQQEAFLRSIGVLENGAKL